MESDNKSEIRRTLGHELPQDAPRAEVFIVIRTGIYELGADDEADDWDLGIYARLFPPGPVIASR